MNSRIPALVLVALLAGAAGWLARTWSPIGPKNTGATASSSERRILYYQSSMHPWIKSDRPGKCTICGMDLAPVFEGESGFTASSDLVVLPTNSLTVVHVQTAPVRRGTLVKTLRLAGTLDDDDSRHRVLSAYTDGRLDRLYVNYPGAEVQAGQPLALWYSPTLLTAVREYLTVADRTTDGLSETARTPLRAAAALRLVQLGMLPEQIERLPSTFTETNLHVEILAPMTGTVVSRNVYEGQTVMEGQALFELADFSTMWLKLDVYEQDLPWLRVGQPVEVEFASHPGHPETHAITFIDPNLQMETRSTQARVEVPNPLVKTLAGPQRRCRHRLLATARVRTELEPVLLVPRSAVLDAGQPRVFVELSDGTYQPRTVVVGRRGDTELEVVSGVTEGERVVTQGALLLDGQAQLNLASQSEPPEPPDAPKSAPARSLTPEQSAAARRFLEQADAVRDSLSADSLERFNELAPRLHDSAAELGQAFTGNPTWEESLKTLIQSSHMDRATDLGQARQQYHALSQPLVTLARAVHGASGIPGVRIYECPMTRRAFPGAPARASWLQLSGPVRNPYFGAEMLDCGTEVKP